MEDFNQAMGSIDSGINQAVTAQQAFAESANASLDAITTNLGSKGSNCRIERGSYIGNGAYGSGSPTSVTFSITPLIVFIKAVDNNYPMAILPNGCPVVRYNGGDQNLTWFDNGVSWYHTTNNILQYNEPGVTYQHFTIGTHE